MQANSRDGVAYWYKFSDLSGWNKPRREREREVSR